jgi:hypothetical protein
MALAGIVKVQLTREQAEKAACWFLDEYKPGTPPPLAGNDWHTQQLEVAHTLGAKLGKAARRKSETNTLNLQFQREHAQWLAAFMSEEQGWWIFTLPDTREDVFVWAQPSPAYIREIARLFLKPATFRDGRPKPKLDEVERRLNRLHQNPYSDERWQRRLRKKKEDLEFARVETEMIKKST